MARGVSRRGGLIFLVGLLQIAGGKGFEPQENGMRFVLMLIALGGLCGFAVGLLISGPTIMQQIYGLALGGFSMVITTLALIGYAVLGRLDDILARDG